MVTSVSGLRAESRASRALCTLDGDRTEGEGSAKKDPPEVGHGEEELWKKTARTDYSSIPSASLGDS